MILVTLGTQDKSFVRLLEKIDEEIKKKNIKEKVVVQKGWTKYKSDNMEMFDYVSPSELDKLMSEARLVITHGGVGSILGALKYNKTVIAVPRLSKYKEHTNDHQLEIVKRFNDEGYLIGVDDLDNLSDALEKSNSFHPKKYTSNNKEFVNLIESYIDSNYKSWWNKYKFLILFIFIIIFFIIIYF